MPSGRGLKKDGKTQRTPWILFGEPIRVGKCVFFGGIGICCLEMYKLFVGRGRERRWPTTKHECKLCVLGRSLYVSLGKMYMRWGWERGPQLRTVFIDIFIFWYYWCCVDIMHAQMYQKPFPGVKYPGDACLNTTVFLAACSTTLAQPSSL